MKLKTVMSMVGVAALAWQIDAAPSVEITGVQQQYPWTNTVDISYNVTGVTNKEYFAVFEARHEGRLLGAVTNELDGTGQAASAVQSLTTQWFPDFDLKKTGVTMTPYIYRGGVGAGDDYLIIDLETWKVTYEGMVTQEDSNRKYNTDEYKTRKIAMRKIPAGQYTIGGPETGSCNEESGNTAHTVTMAKDYYFAIFPLTVAQYNRLNLSSSPGSSKVPMGATWNTVRGSAGSTAVPGSGILRNLNTRLTGNDPHINKPFPKNGFDIPTCSMWEAAARAGVTGTRWTCGNTESDLTNYGWYSGNSSNTPHDVGLKRPNAWGIYELHGNQSNPSSPGGEMTLDANVNQWTTTTNGQTPVGSSNNIWTKGGNCGKGAKACSFQACYWYTKSGHNFMIRLVFMER